MTPWSPGGGRNLATSTTTDAPTGQHAPPHTASNSAGPKRNCYVEMQNDTNLVIYQRSPKKAVWSTKRGLEPQ